MKSELYTQLIQNLDDSTNLLDSDFKNTETRQWKGRSISEAKGMKSEINRMLKPDENENLTDKQLRQRVCTLCNVDIKQKESLELLCSTSPKEGAEALIEVLINTAEKPPMSEAQFKQEVQDWVKAGGVGTKRIIAARHITNAYTKKSITLDLSGLKTLNSLPNVLNQLPHLEKINLSNTILTSLPDTFQNFPNLKTLNLSNTPIEHFPKSLYALKNKDVEINIDNTPITNTFITPGIKRKIHDDGWKISGQTSSHEKAHGLFDKSYGAYENLLVNSKKLGIKPTELIKKKRVPQSAVLATETEEKLLQIQNQKQPRIQNKEDLKEKLGSHDLSKVRLLTLENNEGKINVFGSACPYKKIIDGKDTRTVEESKADNAKAHAANQSFIFNEVDTLITLVGRDENNEAESSIKDYAGTDTLQPVKNVLSIPIPDFQPPRLEHYTTLAKEMSGASSSKEPKSIAIFCGYGEGRTGTLLAASQVINEFKKLDSESRKQLLNTNRNFTPDTFNGTFSYLNKDFKTTPFVGNIVQNIRKSEKENPAIKVGISVETTAQFETLEILQCMLAISEQLNETPPISDEKILELINEKNFSPEPLEEFFQIDYTRPPEEVILESVKNFHKSFS